MDRKKDIIHLWVLALLLMLMGACANMAQGPTGGKSDVEPPTYLGSKPKNGALNVNSKRVEILFDEYLQLSDPSKNLTVSPPQKVNPSAKAIGKKIVVELRDSLQPNTTYTMDFGSSIGDYTENNLVYNFLYTFSTGDQLDSMVISGVVLNAEDLSPVEGAYVGIYSDEEDSTFLKRPFERVARTLSNGWFHIMGAAQKKYRIFALEDMNNNFFFDQPSEGIAVQEGDVEIPSLKIEQKIDTVYGDSMKIDTIIHREVRKYAPDSIVLRFFHEKINFQQFKKIERSARNQFNLFFEKMEEGLPKIALVDTSAENWFMVETNKMADTVHYWITDSNLYRKDTIVLSLSYLKTDSAGVLFPCVDTVKAALSSSFLKNELKTAQQEEAKLRRALKRNRKVYRTNLLNVARFSTVGITETPSLVWDNPLSSFDESKIHLYWERDTTRTPLTLSVVKDTARDNCRRYFLSSPNFHPDSSYRLVVDSACAYDFYGNHNDSLAISFKMLGESLYGKVTVSLTNVQGNAFIELLNAKDGVVRSCPIKENVITFEHLSTGTYFVRIIMDENQNGVWDTGNYREGILPEKVYYFNKNFKVRANWEVSESWDVTATPLYMQRPSGISSKSKKDKKSR
ncbi:MAG: Ig-like domain-containing protein [Paludibacteraceae bacterium]|nr:Ig-like domain-containing protein [Paludibacteraceae bacterium]